jgi:uncharacterized protein YlzI (FlbEa/FlbD family)
MSFLPILAAIIASRNNEERKLKPGDIQEINGKKYIVKKRVDLDEQTVIYFNEEIASNDVNLMQKEKVVKNE